MKKILYFTLFLNIIILSCSSKDNPDIIIDRAIETHGGSLYQNSIIEFNFRDKYYLAKNMNGIYQYERIFSNSEGDIRDILTNDSFIRKIDGEIKDLSSKDIKRFSNSLNSVIYFAVLPFHLSDPAVQKQYLGKSTILGKNYFKIKITFKSEGGGDDFDDEFVYWIDTTSNRMDYLAYRFHVNGGGTRFRQAYNQRKINGIIISNYHNFKGPGVNTNIEEFDNLFESQSLQWLSDIILEEVKVEEILP